MNYQKGIILPILALIALVAIGSGLYYFKDKTIQTSSTSSISTTNLAGVANSLDDSDQTENEAASVSFSSNIEPVAVNAEGSVLVEGGSQGVLAQRLGWNTFTNRDFSYAISFPQGWSQSGDSANAFINGGSVQTTVSSQVLPGTSLADFAATGGGIGAEAANVNGYIALRLQEGDRTAYYIKNGSVGYKISTNSNLSSADAERVRAMLLTFTFIAKR